MGTIGQALLLGVVQGLTEFLPISSTAHLVLVPWALGWESPLLHSLTFDVALHMGTLVAVLAYFRRDWLDLAGAMIRLTRGAGWHDPGVRLALLVIVGTIPAVIAALVFGDLIAGALRSPFQIALALLAFSVVMAVAERVSRRTRGSSSINLGDALAMGIGQAIALIPGVSRSGSTVSTGLFLGLERQAAARLSFLLATPAVAGAGLKQAWDLRGTSVSPDDLTLMLVGAIAAGVSGFLCIRWLLGYLASGTLYPFVIYRVLLALSILAIVASQGALQA